MLDFMAGIIAESERFKVAETERLIYENIGKIKTPNAFLSLLYNMSIGTLPFKRLFNMQPRTEKMIECVWRRVEGQEEALWERMQYYVLLDKLHWVAKAVGAGGCP